jgi:hypothetical protein
MPQERTEDHIGHVGPKKVRNGAKADIATLWIARVIKLPLRKKLLSYSLSNSVYPPG